MDDQTTTDRITPKKLCTIFTTRGSGAGANKGDLLETAAKLAGYNVVRRHDYPEDLGDRCIFRDDASRNEVNFAGAMKALCRGFPMGPIDDGTNEEVNVE